MGCLSLPNINASHFKSSSSLGSPTWLIPFTLIPCLSNHCFTHRTGSFILYLWLGSMQHALLLLLSRYQVHQWAYFHRTIKIIKQKPQLNRIRTAEGDTLRVYNSKPSRKKKAFFLLSKSSVNERLSQFSQWKAPILWTLISSSALFV